MAAALTARWSQPVMGATALDNDTRGWIMCLVAAVGA